MGNIASSNRITAHDRAILDMKIQRDKLRMYQKKIQTVLDKEHEIAKECLRRGDKNRALLALRKRKYQEEMLKKTDNQLETLEQLTSTIEFSLIQKDVMFGLQQGTAVLKEIQKEMSLEAVEKLVGESQDAIAYQKEVSELLGTSMSREDEDAVEEEFAELQRATLAQQNGSTVVKPSDIQLPSVPNAEVGDQESEGEDTRISERQAIPA